MKKENVNQIYSRKDYVNLVWMRVMESDPNKLQITNFLRDVSTNNVFASNKYVINLDTKAIKVTTVKDFSKNIVMAQNESRLFIEFMNAKRNKEIYDGLLYNRILQPDVKFDNGFYIWINNDGEKQMISIARIDANTNKVVCEDGSQITESTIEAVIDEENMYKFNMKNRKR